MTADQIKVYLVEDDPDFILLARELFSGCAGEALLRSGGTLAAAGPEIERWKPDLILLDLMLPDSRGLDTLRSVCSRFPSLPVVVMTSVSDKLLGEEAIAEGAQDYLVKGRCDSQTLLRTIKYSIERKKLLEEKELLIAKLRAALAEVKQLSGLLPICFGCKKIKDKDGKWVKLETYIIGHSEAEFTHGLCEECVGKYCKDMESGIKNGK